MIGYFTSLLKNELIKDEVDSNHDQNFLILAMNAHILSTISDLHKDLFGSSIPNIKFMEGRDKLRSTLHNFCEMFSEKIQRGGESFLEISFLCGSFLTLSEIVELLPSEKQKLGIIIFNLLSALEINISWNDLKKIINDLTSCKIHVSRNSRDQLFSMICGKHVKHQTINDIQNLFESTSSLHNVAFS
jgi:hypothetical protein